MTSTRLATWLSTLLLLVPLSAAQKYTIADLGEFAGGAASQGQAINTIGQVAGYARYSNYNAHGTIWTASTGLVDLGSFPPASNFSVGQGINSFGEVVGYSFHTGAIQQHAVLWAKGTIHDLGTLPGGDYSQASGINDVGQIAGVANGKGISPHAVLWGRKGLIQDLGALSGGYSQAFAINIQGEVAGDSATQDGRWHAIYWNKSTGLRALPYLGPKDTSASANGINNLGQIVGGSGNSATLWQNDQNHTVQSLGTLANTWSTAIAINDVGQVVGWSNFVAFIWTQADGIQDLNTLIPANSGWTLGMATAINNRGQITGEGYYNGAQHAFLLTPVSE